MLTSPDLENPRSKVDLHPMKLLFLGYVFSVRLFNLTISTRSSDLARCNAHKHYKKRVDKVSGNIFHCDNYR
jgi:hypothetical protein